jgi:hypothetical protein
MVPHFPEVTVPRDGSDYKAAKALRGLDAEKIADDVRHGLWEFMRRRGELRVDNRKLSSKGVVGKRRLRARLAFPLKYAK